MSIEHDQALLKAVLEADCLAAVNALADGAKPLRLTTDNITVFELALRLGHIDIAAAMLHNGVHPDSQRVDGVTRTALSFAVVHDIHDLSFARTSLLLSYGADPDVRFTYNGKPDCKVDDVLDDKIQTARAVEEVTIGDLRAMLVKRRAVLQLERDIARRKDVLAQGARNRKFKL